MDPAEINALTANGGSLAAVLEILGGHAGDPLVDDLVTALSATPMHVHMATALPLPSLPEPQRALFWFPPGPEVAPLRDVATRLDRVLDDLDDPTVTARVGDVCWRELRSAGDAPADARRTALRALDAYTAVLQAELDPQETLLLCYAAVTLATELRQTDRVEELHVWTLKATERLATLKESPEVVPLRIGQGLPYLYAILAAWPDFPRVELRRILEVIETRYAESPVGFAFPYMLDFPLRIHYLLAATPEERAATVRVFCDIRLRAARFPFFGPGPNPMVPMELSRAIEEASHYLATESGIDLHAPTRSALVELLDACVVELQQQPPIQVATRAHLVSPEDLTDDARDARSTWEQSVRAIDTENLSHAIEQLGSLPDPLTLPPGLDTAIIARLETGFYGWGQGKIGAAGFVLRDPVRDRPPKRLATGEVVLARLTVWGEVLADAFDQLPSADSENDCFGGPLVADDLRDRFQAALAHFQHGDYDAAAHVALPRLEAVIRAVAIRLGIPTIQTEYHGLGRSGFLRGLLARIKAGLPVDQRCHWSYFEYVLVEETAFPIRNLVSHALRRDHGLVETATRVEAALVLHLAAALSALGDDARWRHAA
jgi:hypothetical protein